MDITSAYLALKDAENVKIIKEGDGYIIDNGEGLRFRTKSFDDVKRLQQKLNEHRSKMLSHHASLLHKKITQIQKGQEEKDENPSVTYRNLG